MLCLICVRSGSKGLPNKNIKKINNKTLLQITIEQAKKIKKIKNIIVSTDSDLYSKISKKYGALVPFKRPKLLSRDNSNEWDVWKHAVKMAEKNHNFDDVLILPVVSPLRKKNDIEKIINKYYENKKNVVITVTKSSRNPYYNMIYFDKSKKIKKLIYKKKIRRRQDAPQFFDICTVGYMLNKSTLKNNKGLFDCNLSLVEIPKLRSIDIDDADDFLISKILYEFRQNN